MLAGGWSVLGLPQGQGLQLVVGVLLLVLLLVGVVGILQLHATNTWRITEVNEPVT